MNIIKDISKKSLNNSITASIGAFDGIHIGHQKILENIVKESLQNNTKSALITFNPIPKIYFSKKNFEILTINKKISLLKNYNLDYLILLRFNKKLISMSSKEFIEDLLINKINIKSLTVGDDFKFGFNQSGNINNLREYSSRGIFSLKVEEKHLLEGSRISSSLIRDAIIKNNFSLASKMLGRPYSISGKIMHGDKRGSKIGFPTANIKLKPNILLDGVYAVSTYINNKVYYGVANIGYKPTFNGNKYLFEAHILDFSKNIYGKRLEFNIFSKIRDTIKFNGINELKKYINNDIDSVKIIFNIK